MMAEVAHYYPGFDLRDGPWPLFLALYRRADRFEKRAELGALRAVMGAVGAALGGEDSGQRVAAEIRRLTEGAYPIRLERQAFIRPEPDDG